VSSPFSSVSWNNTYTLIPPTSRSDPSPEDSDINDGAVHLDASALLTTRAAYGTRRSFAKCASPGMRLPTLRHILSLTRCFRDLLGSALGSSLLLWQLVPHALALWFTKASNLYTHVRRNCGRVCSPPSCHTCLLKTPGGGTFDLIASIRIFVIGVSSMLSWTSRRQMAHQSFPSVLEGQS